MASAAKVVHNTQMAPVPTMKPGETSQATNSSDMSVARARQDGIAFWTKHTKPVLASLLKSVGEYTPEQQASHLKFLDNYIIPSMGHAPEPSRARSLLTPNGSPFETSLNTSDSGKSYVRFCYEPVFPGSDDVTEDPIPRIAEKTGADLRWFNQFTAEFYPSEDDARILAEKMPKDTIRIPKVFLAFDLKEDKQTMKAYFYPVIKWMTSKQNSDRAGFDLIRRLDPLGPAFGPALDMIERYQKKLYQEPPLTVVIGIDCMSPAEGARVKIYIEPQSNTWEAVQQHVTLGGQLADKTTLEGLATLHDMWNILINEPEDKEIDEKFSKEILQKKPDTSGACFSWELKPGQDIPEVKIYVPLNQYFKNDKEAIDALEKVFRKRGWAWGVDGTYKKIVSDVYGSDIIDGTIKTPMDHTFVSFNFSEKKGVYMTTYVAPFVRFS
ncbi:Tryptophan dimethylallyltransferase 2 [Fusarium austroafricanum]|uniref:Tryptophan dimethylallyltransferase 2 n=1 Tax=Fusarium austroafricanum TaxID=2364996 RepID=A0A8H4P3S1_9HYPO|nr:Tryptophan dimethylallyltransferase 2 [Fusarium austroafricanum]